MIIFARPPLPLKMEIDQTLKCDIFKNQVAKYSLKMNVMVKYWYVKCKLP